MRRSRCLESCLCLPSRTYRMPQSGKFVGAQPHLHALDASRFSARYPPYPEEPFPSRLPSESDGTVCCPLLRGLPALAGRITACECQKNQDTSDILEGRNHE